MDVTMPQLGETVTEGTVTRWCKQVGEPVAADDDDRARHDEEQSESTNIRPVLHESRPGRTRRSTRWGGAPVHDVNRLNWWASTPAICWRSNGQA